VDETSRLAELCHTTPVAGGPTGALPGERALARRAAQIEDGVTLLAMVEEPANVARTLAAVGEATEVPPFAGARPPVLEEPRAPRSSPFSCVEAL
jgi:hypothetical protein